MANTKTNPMTAGEAPAHPAQMPQRPRLLHLPGLIAICMYMMLLAAIFVVSVTHHRVGPVYLIFAVCFAVGSLGLLRLRRWAWALTLAGVALMVGLFLWTYTTQHLTSALVQGLLNLVIFLYLVRTDLRDKLR